MATVSQLATEVVEFVAQGVQNVMASIDTIRSGLLTLAGASRTVRAPVAGLGAQLAAAFRAPSQFLMAFGRNLQRVAFMMRGLGMLARRFVLGGAFSLAGLLFGAARGTQEADDFKRALTELSKTIGDKLAPYVRAVTDGIERLSAWWRTLSDETQRSITRWALVTISLAGVAMILPILVRGIASLLMVASLLLDPFVAIPLAILAIGAALLYVTAEGEGFVEKMGSVTERVMMALALLKAGFTSMASAAGNAFGAAGAALDFLKGNNRGAALADFMANMTKLKDNPKLFAKNLADELAMAASVTDRIKAGIRAIANMGEGPGFTAKVKVEFESLQGTWDRLMKSFADSDEAIQKQQLKQQEEMNQKIGMANTQLDVIAGRLPVIV